MDYKVLPIIIVIIIYCGRGPTIATAASIVLTTIVMIVIFLLLLLFIIIRIALAQVAHGYVEQLGLPRVLPTPQLWTITYEKKQIIDKQTISAV